MYVSLEHWLLSNILLCFFFWLGNRLPTAALGGAQNNVSFVLIKSNVFLQLASASQGSDISWFGAVCRDIGFAPSSAADASMLCCFI